jgi:chromosomal replication initiation ATPase DnaA
MSNNNPYFPFHAIGFRCNPFRAVTDDEWVDIAVLPKPVAEIATKGFVNLQVLGEKGCGKTTTLLALAAQFKREGKRIAYEHIEEGRRQFTTEFGGLDVFLLDEAQRLSERERERLLAALSENGDGLHAVIGSHDDLTPFFARRDLPLTTVRYDTTTLAHLSAAIQGRLAYFALDADVPVTLSPEATRYLHETFGGDIRAVEMLLYEVFQRLRERGEIGVEMLSEEHHSGAGSRRSKSTRQSPAPSAAWS